MGYYYDLCCKHHGQVVQITEKCGKRHVGRIVAVDQQYVYLEPVGGHRGPGGFCYGWCWGWRPFFPVALAAIAGFALGAALFWI
ncbi:hypothetical protein P4475_01720 [Halalkalibacterium halodurans]|uniref:hypothetical protein n=1 Tax=Halalkalibacterium halodurans TaxID=86665 RepID=UPI002E1D827B|nr:hypothetical protein [Halalkalibacterium halodurans]